MHDEYSPEGYAERESASLAADREFGEGWETLTSERYVSENDVIGGCDPDADYAVAHGIWSEAMFDPDYSR